MRAWWASVAIGLSALFPAYAGALPLAEVSAGLRAGADADADADADAGVAPRAGDLMLLAVTINGVGRGDAMVARRGGRFFVRPGDLARWRITPQAVRPIAIDGEDFVPLDALPGIAIRFDTAAQRLDLTLPPARFVATTVNAGPAVVPPTEGAFGAFINYDVALDYSRRLAGTAVVEAGMSDDWGLLASTATVGNGGGGRGVTRLDSYFVRDDPAGLTRLLIGDTLTAASDWSRQVRFGGVRFGTEFSLQPSFIPFSTPAFVGRAAVPSSVEVLVNNALGYQTQVGQGPFSVNQLPVATGAGDVTLVVRDALGVERRISSSYYVSPRVLRAGLSDWSLEAGGERADYGVASFRYRNPFVAGSYRRGVADWLTLEGRAEISRTVQMAGGSASLVWPAVGEFGLAAAASHRDFANGTSYRVFFSRITQVWSLSASYQQASKGFSQLGISSDSQRIRRQFQISAGTALGKWGNVSLGYTDLAYVAGNRTRLATANYSVTLLRRAFFSLFALRSRANGQRAATTAGAGLSISFGPRSSGNIQADSTGVSAEYRLTPPTDRGVGYRVSAGVGETDRAQAELTWRTQAGEWTMQAARLNGQSGLRLLGSGGILFANDDAYATRRFDGGFGLVDVPGQPDVRIYQDNRLVARTDASGRAIVPGLRAYEANSIRLAPGDVPIDAQMASDTMIVVPRYFGMARVRFPVASAHPGTIVLNLPDGAAVPAGTAVVIGGNEKSFVGFGGEVFVSQLRSGIEIDAAAPGGTCHVIVHDIHPGESLPRIGPLTCTPRGEKK